MKRINDKNINSPSYLDNIWLHEPSHHYDEVRLRALLKYVKPLDFVIELGAGRFSASQYAINEMKIDAEFLACDYSKVARDMTLKVCPTLQYDLCDIFDNDYPDNGVDCVMCGEVIEHLEEPQKLVDEMYRLVKPDGWLTLTTVDETCEQAKAHNYPEHVWSFEPVDLLRMFDKCKCKEVKYSLVGNYRFIEAQK